MQPGMSVLAFGGSKGSEVVFRQSTIKPLWPPMGHHIHYTIFNQENTFENVVLQNGGHFVQGMWVNNEPFKALASIIWTNDGLIQWCIYMRPSTSLGIHCKLTLHVRFQVIKRKCWFELSETKIREIESNTIVLLIKITRNCRTQMELIFTFLLHFELSGLTIHKFNNTYDLWLTKTHLSLVPYICINESSQHWFRWYLVAYSLPSH